MPKAVGAGGDITGCPNARMGGGLVGIGDNIIILSGDGEILNNTNVRFGADFNKQSVDFEDVLLLVWLVEFNAG